MHPGMRDSRQQDSGLQQTSETQDTSLGCYISPHVVVFAEMPAKCGCTPQDT